MINIEPPSSSFDLTGVNKSGLSCFLNRARVAVGLSGDVDVLLTSDAELKRLNKAFRGKNKATDVLSFPAFPARRGKVSAPPWAKVIGSIVISRDTARVQAKEQRHSYRAEVVRLLVHGVCHCVGYDHERSARDEKLMFAEEDRILALLEKRGVL